MEGDELFPGELIVLSVIELYDREIASDTHVQITDGFLEEVVDLFGVVVPGGNLEHLNL